MPMHSLLNPTRLWLTNPLQGEGGEHLRKIFFVILPYEGVIQTKWQRVKDSGNQEVRSIRFLMGIWNWTKRVETFGLDVRTWVRAPSSPQLIDFQSVMVAPWCVHEAMPRKSPTNTRCVKRYLCNAQWESWPSWRRLGGGSNPLSGSNAGMLELVDRHAWGACGRTPVWVRVPLPAPTA